MATSMFDPSGRFISTDPKAAEAFLKGTGGQILPSSPAAQRAWELSQQRAMQMQQGMAEGRQAVEGLKAQQALTPPTISGLPSSQVVTSDTGYKAVLDAQGNIVGTSAPTAPVSASVGKFADERAAFNRGEGTMLEKAALGPNIRDAFLKEYAKKAPEPVQAVAVPSFIDKLGQPTFGTQTLPNDTPDNASRVARQIFGGGSAPSPAAAPPTPAYVPYGSGENYKPVDEQGQPLSAEAQTAQLFAATPTMEQGASMFQATALRKTEMRKRQERDAALKSGNREAAKKLSDEIEALRKKYMQERTSGGYDPTSRAAAGGLSM